MKREFKSNEPTYKEQGFYHSSAWRRVRRLALQRDHYLCQLRLSDRCTHIATEVHHTKPVEQYPELRLDLNNLVSVCWNCHELTKAKKKSPELPVRIIKA